MARPEVVIGSRRSREDASHYTFGQHTSPSEQLLVEDQMRRKLKFFFIYPCEKFWTRGRKPWKLGIQILKIAMVTIQCLQLCNISAGNHACENKGTKQSVMAICQHFYKSGNIYLFISLFIYMILSLFIALITDTYEMIKHYQQNGFPETELRKFISECKDLPNSGKYRLED